VSNFELWLLRWCSSSVPFRELRLICIFWKVSLYLYVHEFKFFKALPVPTFLCGRKELNIHSVNGIIGNYWKIFGSYTSLQLQSRTLHLRMYVTCSGRRAHYSRDQLSAGNFNVSCNTLYNRCVTAHHQFRQCRREMVN